MGRGAACALDERLLTRPIERRLARFLGSEEQRRLLEQRLREFEPSLRTLSFSAGATGIANLGEGSIVLPAPDERLAPLAQLVETTRVALHEIAHLRHTDRAVDRLLDCEEARYQHAGAAASWQQQLGIVQTLEDARIEECLLGECPQLEPLFRAEGALERITRTSLDVSGKTYFEQHFALLDASDPYALPTRGVSRKARKLAEGMRELIEFAAAGGSTANAALAAHAVAGRLYEHGRWLKAFGYGSRLLEDERETLVGWSAETLEELKARADVNREQLERWRRRGGAFSERELDAYLDGIAAAESAEQAQLALLSAPRY